MNNWKLRSTITGKDGMDFVEVNGHLASLDDPEDTLCEIIPFGDKYAAPIRTTASDDFGPVRNQVPGICNGTFTHTTSANGQVASTTLTGEGSGATFYYTFLADGTLSSITAATGGSNYKVGDKLQITTNQGHVIQFRLVDGSNTRLFAIRLVHDQGVLPYRVHKVRITETSDHTIQVLDPGHVMYSSPQDKLLDKYPDAAAAYGLRKLRSAYLGPAIRVRSEASGFPTIDVGFDSQGNLDTKALLDFAGTNSVRVTTWYDQSGNGNDATTTANAKQPTIVGGGVLRTVNGKPAMTFDGSDDDFILDHSDLYGQTRLDAYMHYQSDDSAYMFFTDPDSGSNYSFVAQDGSTTTALSGNYKNGANEPTLHVNGVSIPAVPGAGNNTRDDLHTALITNGAEHSTGAVVVHQGAGTSAWTNFGISTRPDDTTFKFAGKVTEVVLYNTDQSANRENIEKDMALYSGAFEVEDAPLLDAYGGAHAAYSLRKLNSDYTGAAVRVRRVSDNAELDLGFKSDGTLDTDAADAFWDGSNLTTITWYDQSGNGNDVTANPSGREPLLYNNTGLIPLDGRPSLRFVGDDAFPFDHTGLDRGNLSTFVVMKFSSTTGTQRAIQLSTGVNDRWYAPVLSSGFFLYAHGDGNIGTNSANNANNLHTVIAGATQGDAEAFLNGTSIGTKALTTGALQPSSVIGGTGSDYLNGFIQEVVVYSSDQSERRLGIERNIKNHYEL